MKLNTGLKCLSVINVNKTIKKKIRSMNTKPLNKYERYLKAHNNLDSEVNFLKHMN